MKIEYEAKFLNINKREIRKLLKEAGAVLARSEFLQRRVVFNLPESKHNFNTWLRVRDEEGVITVSLKIIDGDKIQDQRETQIIVDDFEKSRQIFKNIGCIEKAYQESKRELWILENVEITIDEWPFLEPYIEVEGNSEEEVKGVVKRIGFNYEDAVFGLVSKLISMKYGIPEKIVNNEFPRVVFNEENPFKKYLNQK